MEALARELDRALHGAEELSFAENEEGELSVLMSEIKKLILRLREQNALLSEDRLRLTSAIEDIFHQIRTPLTSMGITVSLLAAEDIDYRRRVQLARELRRGLERTSWLVETLLKLSKIDAGTAVFTRERVGARELIEEAAEPFLIPMELKDQRLTVNASDEMIYCDGRWTLEAVSNLIKNAHEHTPEGGAITVTAAQNALYSSITVSDTGPGLPKGGEGRVFERFYKAPDAPESGVGIGLALTRAIVTSQGGTITAKNGKEGAVFEMKLYNRNEE